MAMTIRLAPPVQRIYRDVRLLRLYEGTSGADLGSRVVKIERTDAGDPARSYDHVVHGTGSHFVWLNRGTQSVALDLEHPACLEAVG